MTVPAPTACPRATAMLVPGVDPQPFTAGHPCCYWDHRTAQWVPLPVPLPVGTSVLGSVTGKSWGTP